MTFTDGLVRELDFSGTLTGILNVLDSDKAFGEVQVDPVSRTISWPGGIDFDPDVLHGDFESENGASARLIQQYRIALSGVDASLPCAPRSG